MREGALPSRTNQARVVSEILDLAKREKFRVNLIEAYDQPWKRQLEGTVGGYWGLIDDAQRAVKYPPGEPISNYPFWKLQMGCGMALSAFVFLAGWLTLRRRPWKPRLAVVDRGRDVGDVGRHAARGRRGQDVLRELRGRRLAAMGRAAGGRHRLAVAVRERCDVGTAAADVPRTARAARLPRHGVLPALLGLVLVVTTLIAAQTALGFAFDPRYRDFPFASLTMAVVPFAALMLLNRPKEGVRPIAESAFAGLLGGGRAVHRLQRGQPELAVDVDLRGLSAAGAHAVAGAGRANPKISRPIAIPDSAIL